MVSVGLVIAGPRTGNFRPQADQDDGRFDRYVETRLLQRGGVHQVINPRCRFTDTIFDTQGPGWRIDQKIVRPDAWADGAIVYEIGQGILFLPADCCTVVVLDQKTPKLAALHVGYRSLFEGPNHRPATILERLFTEHNFPRDSVSVSLGWCIGPCCFGVEHYPKVSGVTYSVASTGPRKGQRSLNLGEVVLARLLALEIPREAIKVSDRCTSCQEYPDGNGSKSFTYHSHCRDGDSAGRNAFLVYLKE